MKYVVVLKNNIRDFGKLTAIRSKVCYELNSASLLLQENVDYFIQQKGDCKLLVYFAENKFSSKVASLLFRMLAEYTQSSITYEVKEYVRIKHERTTSFSEVATEPPRYELFKVATNQWNLIRLGASRMTRKGLLVIKRQIVKSDLSYRDAQSSLRELQKL